VAKSRRTSFAQLPLSEAFYALLARTAARAGTGASGGAALAEAVAELSRVYTRERSTLSERAGGQTALGARLDFFLPRDLVKIFGPLQELARAGRLPRDTSSLRVLDVGAGLGATSLGLSRWLKLHGRAIERLEVTALERDRGALELFRRLSGELPALADEFVPIRLEARAEDVADAQLGQGFDLVLLGFVLNELFAEAPLETRIAQKSQLLVDAAARLRPGGALIVLEPALKATTRELMQVRDQLAARGSAPHVFAPCVRRGPCPMLANERDWCHQELAYALPPRLASVAQLAGLRFEGLSYASLILTREPRALPEAAGEPLYRIVSERLESKGKLELYGCGEPGYVRLSLLERDSTARNAAFGAADRGSLVRVAGTAARLGKDTDVTSE
jgi:SAM-dependent methyltransferase